MALDEDEKPTLKIRCPKCSQRFNVNADLRGRTVECGGCEHRFRITDDAIVRTKRFYPGERPKPFEKKFARVPKELPTSHDLRPLHPTAPTRPALNPAHYGKEPDPAVIGPVSPQRILAGIVGVAGMAMMALLLIFGSGKGGIVDGMSVGNRLVIAVFAALIGVVFLVYANPKARMKASLVGALMAAGVISLPFFFRSGSQQFDPTREARHAAPLVEEKEEDPEAVAFEALKRTAGVEPLEKERKRLEELGTGRHAYGVWIKGLNGSDKLQVRDYLIRVCEAGQDSYPYPRDERSYLMVLTDLGLSLEEVAERAKALGTIIKVHEDIGVIEMTFDESVFAEGSFRKLSDKNDPAFYDLNKRELDGIRLERVERAVQRLAGAEPKLYRKDITKRLLELVADPSIKFKGAVCRALLVWQEEPQVTTATVGGVLKQLQESGEAVPGEMVELLSKLGHKESIPVVAKLWLADPLTWEIAFQGFGPDIENEVIANFDKAEGLSLASAVRVLGRVGSRKSLPVLERAKAGASPELRILIENAEELIHGRVS